METRSENSKDNDILTPIRRDPSTTRSTETILPQITTINLDNLITFTNHPFQIYEGERLEKLAISIKETGLLNPIVVRPLEEGTYEILSGHNRVEAARLLGWKAIEAIIKYDLTDDAAERIVLESNLNQQSFLEWKFSQQIQVIKKYSKYIKDNSQQGARNDIAEKSTCDHSGHKLEDKPKRLKTRDKISKSLGISSTVFERYRSIAKLNDDALTVICGMLDEKRLGFMAAYRISKLKPDEIIFILNYMKDNLNYKPRGKNIELLHKKSKSSEDSLTNQEIREMLLIHEWV